MNDTLDLPPIEAPAMPVATQPAAPEPGTLKAREEEAARLEAQRQQQEAERAELERQAAAMRAEQARIARLTAMIAEIRAAATGHDNASAADLYEARIAVAALDVSEAQYQEFALVAQAAQAGTLAVLDRLHRDATAREAERAEVERVLSIPLPLTIPDEPELLAQDECRELSKALAADPAAPLHAREAAAAIADAAVVDAAVKAGMDAVYAACVPMHGPTLTLGKFNEWIAPLKIDDAGLEALGFTAVKVHNAKLYHEGDRPAMVAAMVKHLQAL